MLKNTGWCKGIPVFLILFCLIVSVICITAEVVLAEHKAATPPDIRVSGVMADEENALAVINDALVEEGDVVDGVKILKITDSGVQCEYQGKVFTKAVEESPGRKLLRTIFRRRTERERARKRQETLVKEIKGIKKRGKIVTPGALERLKHNILTKIHLEDEFDRFVFQKLGFAKLIHILLVLLISIHLYFGLCLYKIAKKTGSEYKWAAWIPPFNILLMFAIADKPLMWFFFLLLPIVNIIIMVLLWMGIAEACGKPAWIGLLALIPLVNFVMMGYLAFSR